MLTCCFASFDLYLQCVSSWSNIFISVFSVVWVLPPWNWTRNWIFRLTLQTLRLLTAPVRLRTPDPTQTPDRRPCWTSGLLGLSDSSALSWESWESCLIFPPEVTKRGEPFALVQTMSVWVWTLAGVGPWAGVIKWPCISLWCSPLQSMDPNDCEYQTIIW